MCSSVQVDPSSVQVDLGWESWDSTLGLCSSLWFGKQDARGACLTLAMFCPRYILEEPEVPAVGLEAPGGREVPDAL